MAEEQHYSSDSDEAGQPQCLSDSDDSDYDENEIALLKWKAQDIAARLLRNPDRSVYPKYHDSPRTERGFSSRPDSSAPSPYDTVPPPVDEIQAAKRKAEEVASRLLRNSGLLHGGGSNAATTAGKPQTPSDLSKEIEIPSGRAGVIVGNDGEIVKNIEIESGAEIRVRTHLEVMGSPDQIAKAEDMINGVLSGGDDHADAGCSN